LARVEERLARAGWAVRDLDLDGGALGETPERDAQRRSRGDL